MLKKRTSDVFIGTRNKIKIFEGADYQQNQKIRLKNAFDYLSKLWVPKCDEQEMGYQTCITSGRATLYTYFKCCHER